MLLLSNLAKAEKVVHPAAFMMTLTAVSQALAANELDDLVLCGVNCVMSIPAVASVDFYPSGNSISAGRFAWRL